MSTRVRWPFLAAALLAVVAATLTYLWPAMHAAATAADEMPTAAQAAPAVRLAASLPEFLGATRDRYDTACGGATPYCVTSSSLSARQLATGTERLLAGRGAKAESPTACDGDSGYLDGLGDCGAKLRFRGVEVGVFADNARAFDGLRRPARAYVVVVADLPTPPSKPLGRWTSLALFPAAWGTPSCVQAAPGGGCWHYKGNVTVQLPLAQVLTTVKAQLARSGLAADMSHCAPAARYPGCLFGAMRFRGLDGRDPVNVTVHVTRLAATTTRIAVLVTN